MQFNAEAAGLSDIDNRFTSDDTYCVSAAAAKNIDNSSWAQ